MILCSQVTLSSDVFKLCFKDMFYVCSYTSLCFKVWFCKLCFHKLLCVLYVNKFFMRAPYASLYVGYNGMLWDCEYSP